MKKSIFLIAALSLACLAGFSQSTKKDSASQKAGQPAGPAPVVAHQPQQYFILLSQEEFTQLYNFVCNSDIYNEKGRGQCLEFIKQHTYLVPPVKDTVAGQVPKPQK